MLTSASQSLHVSRLDILCGCCHKIATEPLICNRFIYMKIIFPNQTITEKHAINKTNITLESMLLTLLTLYYSVIYPYLIYCVEVWGSTSKKKSLPLLTLQKRAIRLILSVPVRTESAPLFLSLNDLPIFDTYMYKISLLMYKTVHSKVSPSIINMFTLKTDVYTRCTRQFSG